MSKAKGTASELSSLAAKILLHGYKPTEEEIRSMAASLLAQDKVKGQE